ncbi:MAG: YkgJ family cysteine cluster protein [Candidatus Helarchaeota archaeon]
MVEFTCLRCGNCCKKRYLCVYYSELDKFESIKNKTTQEFQLIPFRFYVDKTNKIIIDIIYRSNLKPCPFLKENLCGIENNKFISCKKFPIATWIDLGFLSKLGTKRLHFELDNHCSFLKNNEIFYNSIKKLKLEDVFKREINANYEDHEIWTKIHSKIRKLKKKKKFEIIIDYKYRKRNSQLLKSIINKWEHKPTDVYFEEFFS